MTRLISRAGRPMTGVDRVEFAYLRYFLADAAPVYGLVKTSLGYLLLDRSGLTGLFDRLEARVPWGTPDVLSRVRTNKQLNVQRAESDMRRLAVGRSLRGGLSRLVRRVLPRSVVYYNIGHSNLTQRTLSSLKKASVRVYVFIHDTIPLDFPHYQRPGTSEIFRQKLMQVRAYADGLIFNSEYTKIQTTSHMSAWGSVPDGQVAALGIDVPAPDATELPREVDLSEPYFVSVGTIEPRKRHDLLLECWDALIAEHGVNAAPKLYICGGRGWNNDAVFERLDALSPAHPVKEINGLSDKALSALVSNAAGMVFPSECEGFGLPPIEAVTLGTPVICRDLPVYRETLGDIPVYLQASDRYLLMKLVQSLLHGSKIEQSRDALRDYVAPTWEAHFQKIFET